MYTTMVKAHKIPQTYNQLISFLESPHSSGDTQAPPTRYNLMPNRREESSVRQEPIRRRCSSDTSPGVHVTGSACAVSDPQCKLHNAVNVFQSSDAN